jgi:hypothetical protein
MEIGLGRKGLVPIDRSDAEPLGDIRKEGLPGHLEERLADGRTADPRHGIEVSHEFLTVAPAHAETLTEPTLSQF